MCVVRSVGAPPPDTPTAISLQDLDRVGEREGGVDSLGNSWLIRIKMAKVATARQIHSRFSV